jgi:hypothetical protein
MELQKLRIQPRLEETADDTEGYRLSSGDFAFYTKNSLTLMSVAGNELFAQSDSFRQLVKYPPISPLWKSLLGGSGSESISVTKQTVGGDSFAVKRMAIGLSGIEVFTAMRLLEGEGVQVAEPMIATNRTLITRWVDGKSPRFYKQAFSEYIDALLRIAGNLDRKGLWQSNWKIDMWGRNCKILDETQSDPLKRYISFDPVCVGQFHHRGHFTPAPAVI